MGGYKDIVINWDEELISSLQSERRDKKKEELFQTLLSEAQKIYWVNWEEGSYKEIEKLLWDMMGKWDDGEDARYIGEGIASVILLFSELVKEHYEKI